MFKFKIGDTIKEKDPFTDRMIKYKVVDTFQNYWQQNVYELECINPASPEYGNYHSREFAFVVDEVCSLEE